MSGAVVRVLLSEDDLMVRKGLQNLIESIDGFEVVGAVGDLPAAEDAVKQLKPDVVVTDIRLPPTQTDEGLQLAEMLRQRYPSIGLVALTHYAEPEYARALLADGSAGRAYLLKERVTDTEQLEAAMRAVAQGASYVDSIVVERVLRESSGGPASRLDALTPRELEVMGLIAEAKSNDAVARELGISTRAVERHINGIFNRLQVPESPVVNRRVAAVLMYLEHRHAGESPGRS